MAENSTKTTIFSPKSGSWVIFEIKADWGNKVMNYNKIIILHNCVAEWVQLLTTTGIFRWLWRFFLLDLRDNTFQDPLLSKLNTSTTGLLPWITCILVKFSTDPSLDRLEATELADDPHLSLRWARDIISFPLCVLININTRMNQRTIFRNSLCSCMKHSWFRNLCYSIN